MTQREMYNTISTMMENMTDEDFNALVETEFSRNDIIEGIKDRIFALDKKRTSSSDKPSKKQLENEELYNDIVAIMADGVTRTVRQITETYNSTHETDLSTNKIQPQVTKATKNGELERAVVKGTVYFTRAVVSSEVDIEE